MIFRQGVTAGDLADVRELLGHLDVLWRYSEKEERWEVLRSSDLVVVAVNDPVEGWVRWRQP